MQKAEKEVANHGPLKKEGGVCPDCQLDPLTYSWVNALPRVIRKARRTAIRDDSLALGVLGFVLSGIVALLIPDLRGPMVLIATAAGAVLGAVIGARAPLEPGPPPTPQRDGLSRTEAEWRELEAECDQRGLDPSKVWLYTHLGHPPESATQVLSLPLQDWTLIAPD